MKKLLPVIAMAAIVLTFSACKSKVKDADIKASVETALKADPMSMGTMVTSVNDGVVTISGECKDEMCKTHCGDMVSKVKGVKSVVNNCMVAPMPVPVVNASDEMLNKGLADALKDHPSVKSSVVDGKIVLTGEIAKAKWMALKQMLDKLTSKGYELSGLKIK